MNDSGFKLPTPKQLRALAAIDALTQPRGAGPSLRELAARLGIAAVSAAQYHVLVLEREGLVTFDLTPQQGRAAARTLRVTDRGHRVLARYARLRTTNILRGDRELVLDAHALAVAKKIKLPMRGFHLPGVMGQTVITFRREQERDYWAGLLLQALGEENVG